MFYWKPRLVYLSGGKVAEHLIWTWCIGPFFWAVGKEKKILFIKTKSGRHPPLLPVHSFSEAAVFQESRASFSQIFMFLNPFQPNQGVYSLNVSTSVTQQKFLQ